MECPMNIPPLFVLKAHDLQLDELRIWPGRIQLPPDALQYLTVPPLNLGEQVAASLAEGESWR